MRRRGMGGLELIGRRLGEFLVSQFSESRPGSPSALLDQLLLMMDCVVLVGERGGLIFRIAKGHYGTTGVGEDAVDSAIVGEVVNGRAGGRAKDDQACVEIDRGGEDLDCGMA